MDTTLPVELTVLGWSIILLLVHIVLQSSAATRDNGLAHNAGPRDEKKPVSVMTGRLERAKANFLETYPIFIGLALGLAVTGQTGGSAATGAVIWIVARLLYLPLYAFGVPYIRSLAFLVSVVGLLMMLWRFLF